MLEISNLKSNNHERQCWRHFVYYEWFRCRVLYGNELIVLLLPPQRFLSLICRENQANKYALVEMQCDEQYCLTEMENSFVGQVIYRNCGFRSSLFLSVPSFSYRFSLLYCRFLSFPPSRKLNRGTTNRTSTVLIMRPMKKMPTNSVIAHLLVRGFFIFIISLSRPVILGMQRRWLKARTLWSVIAWLRI